MIANQAVTAWTSIVDVSQLPAIGTDESETLDFKREPWGVGDKDKLELLRDVVQFHNHLGGTLIIGAAEQNGRLSGFFPVQDPEVVAARIRSTCYERLSPRMEPEVVTLNVGGLDIIVVNAQASNGPVAIRVGDRWEFYRRYGKSKMPFGFEEAEHMWGDGRRGKLQLLKIPESQLKNVFLDIEVPHQAQRHFLFEQFSTITRNEDDFSVRPRAGSCRRSATARFGQLRFSGLRAREMN